MMSLVIAYHLIWTAYGWWLPNDPRGSGSKAVRRDQLRDLGELHFGRKKIQPASWKVGEFYENAVGLLAQPPVEFGAAQIAAIAEAFGAVIREMKYTCYACAIMPDHVHILIRKHKHLAEDMILNLQRASHERLLQAGLRLENHRTWSSGGGWKVFLDHPDEVRRTIGYIDDNLIKIGWPRQQWNFVTTPYDGWPLHAGHDPNSPWARGLRAR
jgi:REP element-mobilizing transposase RayT